MEAACCTQENNISITVLCAGSGRKDFLVERENNSVKKKLKILTGIFLNV